MATAPDTRPTREYTCLHCGGMGEVEEDRIEYWPITRPCGYCEGRGYFERPILPRGAVRAFAVSWVDEWGEVSKIVLATSAAKAKMILARYLTQDSLPYMGVDIAVHPVFESIGEAIRELRVRRAPEHDPEGGN